MNVSLISPARNLIEEVVTHLCLDGKDYASQFVVFPGKRPGHFLRKAIADKVQGSFIPPAVLSADEFIDYAYEIMQGRLDKKLEPIDAVALLYEIHCNARKPLGGSGFLSPDTFFPLGLKIYRDIEELHIEKIPYSKVTDIDSLARQIIPEQTAARLQSLAMFYRLFYERLGGTGFSTRSSRYRAVADSIEDATACHFQKIIIAGFFALTQSEKDIFKKMSAWHNTVFIFQKTQGINERLSGLDIPIDNTPCDMDGPEIHLYSSPDTHGQVCALSGILKSGMQMGSPMDEKTVIVLPTADSLFPLIRQTLPLFEEGDYNISLGYPLHRTPVFAFLMHLMDLINSMDGDRVYVPDYLKFILHPYTKNICYRGKSEVTRILFHSVEEQLRLQATKTFLSLAEIQMNRAIIESTVKNLGAAEPEVIPDNLLEHLATVHADTIMKFRRFKNIRDFTDKCTELLMYIYRNSTARHHPLFHPFAESFIEALDTLGQSFMKDVSFDETASYFTLFKQYVMTRSTPFEGTPLRGLQVLGFLETRNLQFDTVFMLNVNEDILPDTRKEETLLPFKAREILGIPTYIDRDALSACYFETLLNGAKRVHLFFIESEAEQRSRFIEQILWQKQQRDRTVETYPYIRPVQYRLNLENKMPQAVGKTQEIVSHLTAFQYSATALDSYLKCPLQFYYRNVLRIDKKEEVSGDIERMHIGTLVHRCLADFSAKRCGVELRPADIDFDDMDRIIKRVFDEHYGERLSGRPYLLKTQIQRQMRNFLRSYILPLIKEQAVKILHVEHKIGIVSDQFNLKGRLDCVQKRNDKIVIIDHKITANAQPLKINCDKLDLAARKTWSSAIGSLQIPFYLLLYCESTNTAITGANGLYMLLGKSALNRGAELPLFTERDDVTSIFALLQNVIFKLLQEIVDPVIPFFPAEDKKRLCPSCNFQYLCGTQWVKR